MIQSGHGNMTLYSSGVTQGIGNALPPPIDWLRCAVRSDHPLGQSLTSLSISALPLDCAVELFLDSGDEQGGAEHLLDNCAQVVWKQIPPSVLGAGFSGTEPSCHNASSTTRNVAICGNDGFQISSLMQKACRYMPISTVSALLNMKHNLVSQFDTYIICF